MLIWSLSVWDSTKTFWLSLTSFSDAFSSFTAAAISVSAFSSSFFIFSTFSFISVSFLRDVPSLAFPSFSLCSTEATGVTKSRPSSYES